MKRRNVARGAEDNGFAEWGGYMAAKKAKLLEQFQSDIDKNCMKSTIFNGIGILVNGYTKPSSEELKQLMLEHGGVFNIYQIPGMTTHIIASNLPNVKIKNMSSIPIVKPDWIVDSVRALKLLDYKQYLLYTNQSISQLQLNFEKLNGETKVESHAKNATKTALTATDPQFISEFYNNSRLHLIATLGAEFKQLVNKLREKSQGKFIGLEKLGQSGTASL